MKMYFKTMLSAVFLWMALTACAQQSTQKNEKSTQNKTMDTFEIVKNESEWRNLLTPVQFNILREKGTERPYTGEYDKFFEKGTYSCAACGTELFKSDSKYNSGCGWPAFYEPATDTNIVEKTDYSHGMKRVEVLCARCGGHFGHVFTDGPEPTGLRYCINSGALKFEKQ